jgi:protein gp37
MDPKWARSLRDQANANGIKFLFKQWGEWGPASNASDAVERVGKVAAGRLLNGRTWDEYPESRLK